MLRITLRPREERRIKAGHPWIFSNEISETRGERTPGAAAEVFDAGGSYLGTGYFNPSSLIAVRLLSRSRDDIDSPDFYRRRILDALALRESLYPGWTTYRVVYGESDFLPGLVVDRYGDYLSIQILTAGMESRRDLLLPVLEDIFRPRGIMARNDVAVRLLEGLPEAREIVSGDIPETVPMVENGLTFNVSLAEGQKTGHFLDQKENHRLLEHICRGKEVLDCFSYSGSWGVHAASYGASSVTCVDISARALAIARLNAESNGLASVMRFEEADAFDRLRSLKGERRFDVVVLDPPAFVKSKKNIAEARKGYLTINRRALELLRPGGYLITCSCSYHIDREAFQDIARTAALQAGREVRLVARGRQGGDHPVLLSFPESEYLKCLLLQAA